MPPNDAVGIVNSEDPDQTPPLRAVSDRSSLFPKTYTVSVKKKKTFFHFSPRPYEVFLGEMNS